MLAEQKRANRDDGERLRRDLTKTEREITNIMAAIKAGILTPTTKTELEKAEQNRARLERTLNLGNGGVNNVEYVLPHAIDRYRDLIADLGKVVSREMSRARNDVRELVGGSIRLVPTASGGLNAETHGNYAGLVALAAQDAKKSGCRVSDVLDRVLAGTLEACLDPATGLVVDSLRDSDAAGFRQSLKARRKR